MANAGRESKYNAERHESIIRDLASGLTRACAAARAGISERTLTRWLACGRRGEIPFVSFVAAVKKAEHDAEAVAVAMIRRIGFGEWVAEEVITTTTAKDGTTSTTTKRKNGRPEWTALAWWLERKWPDHYGKDVEIMRELKAMVRKSKKP